MRGPRSARLSRATAALCAALIATWTAVPPAVGSERYRRDWSDHPGMPRGIRDLDYDDRGFLWLASEEGIHRFDGQEVVPWSPPGVREVVGINRGPGGRLVAFAEQGAAWEVVASGVEALDHAGGTRLGNVHDADYGPDGMLWVCDDAGLFRRDAVGSWSRVALPPPEGQVPIRVRGAPGGGAFVGTNRGAFVRVGADGAVQLLFAEPSGLVTRIAVKDGRTQAFALRYGTEHGIYLVEDGAARLVWRPASGPRWTGLAFRDDTLWVASTVESAAILDDGRRVEPLGPEHGFPPGGDLVVDHEKSLWLTSLRGTYQFPEPDVELVTEMFGTREVHRVRSDVVVGRWRGPHRLEADGGWRALGPAGYEIFDVGGVAPWGSTWWVAVREPRTPRHRATLLEIRRDGWTEWVVRDYGVFDGAYATDERGKFWIVFDDTLWRVDRAGAAPRPVAKLALEKAVPTGLVVDGGRARAAFRYQPYCEARLNAAGDALDGAWECETIEGARELLASIEVDGDPWLATWDRGVVRRRGGTWETIVGEEHLGTPTVRGISTSPRGGVWAMSYLDRVRVELRDGRAEVVERLGPWIGVPNWMTFSAREQENGTVWLTGMTSAVRIPAHARARPTDPPPIFATGFRADGRDLAPDAAHELPASTRRIELRWSSPAFRDPASLRFEVRAGESGAWVPTRERSFRFAGLEPGDHRIEVRASLDGKRWSAEPAGFRFSIRSPLRQRPAFWLGLLAVVAVGGLLVQALRARQHLRLERQRTEIAMNLHDELGAGLASIGLLADLAGGELDPAERREVAGRVGEISRGLSRSLSDIVWTLRPNSTDLAGFALFLRQRAADLLSAGETVVEFDFPEPPPAVRLQLAVRRQIHAIASEALHNAARHAGATRVCVGLSRDGAAWILRVEDDGVGFAGDGGGGRVDSDGLGLESMRRRAQAIGARLTVDSAAGAGCRLELRFRPHVEGRR
ncbi:MAG TPA: ATP-binding protein [Candidatus Polarisedimenticolaceae bacterium]|nr:ATP-binding protein [Candidatus Polarisedimenticolaceae bacterium]